MNYIELNITITPNSEEISGIIIAELGELGYESFQENDNGVSAYILKKDFDLSAVNSSYLINNLQDVKIEFTHKEIEQQNWNELWESNFDPVFVSEDCIIRAPFHDISPKPKYELVIMPKMSFGTGHHETTKLMMEKILDLKLKNKTVLDMGCGTGVLAILASMKGAKGITAIDNDEWAYKNSVENIKVNNIKNIKPFLGDASLIKNKKYDVVIANINKNILLRDIKFYSETIESKGVLVVSGIYKQDFTDIVNEAKKYNLNFTEISEKNKWISILFKKN